MTWAFGSPSVPPAGLSPLPEGYKIKAISPCIPARQTQGGPGGVLGGIEWGTATDGAHIFINRYGALRA